MLFQKGRPKIGGRKKGTPNKRTVEVEEKLAALGCDPIANLAELAKHSDVKIRLAANSELAQYLVPKRKAVEHSGPEGETLSVNIILEQ